MQMKKRKSFIILLSALIAVMLILSCAFMFTPKTAHAEDSTPSNNLYWGFDEDTGVLTLSGINPDNTLAPYSTIRENNVDYPAWYNDRSNITSVTVADSVYAPSSMELWFQGCSNLTAINNLTNLDTSRVSDMSVLFRGCSGLTSLDLSNFDTSKVTSMAQMFYGCSSLNSLNVSNFDTTQVKFMHDMFRGCSGLTSLDLSNFDTSGVTNMSNMFGNCSNLIKLDLSSFNTSKVMWMSSMFSGCSGLQQFDFSAFPNFKTTNVTQMNYMFYGCSGLTSLNVSTFETSKVTWMSCMFCGCSGLTTLDLSSFDTPQVTSMSNMFSDCSDLNTITVSDSLAQTLSETSNTTYLYETKHATWYGTDGTAYTDSNRFNQRGTYVTEAPTHTHIFGDLQPEILANCTTSGTKEHKDCSVCRKHFDESGAIIIADVTIPALGHDLADEWTTDENSHWHVCANGCGVKVDEADHSGTDDGDCTTAVVCSCGYEITAAQASHDFVNGECTHCDATAYFEVTANGVTDNYVTIELAWAAANTAGTATVKMYADAETTDTLTVEKFKNITLDLNGHMLKYNDLTTRNPVFTVNGNFTLADSSATATIKRQHNYYINIDGVWIFVDDDFEPAEGQEIKALIGGVITGGTGHHVWVNGNSFYYGGGVFIGNGATFTMQSGSICGNYARYGSGVYVDSNATFTMESGSISGNRAEEGGGVYVYGGTFIMKGGSISENSATHGGGVYVMGSTFEMSDGEISSNSSGVYFVSGAFKISGAPVIKDNCNSDGRVSNVYLEGYATIAVIGELGEGAIIGVSKTGAVATGYDQTDKPSEFFISDNSENNCVYVSKTTNGTVSIGTHTAETDDDCTTAVLCENCGYEIKAAQSNHNFKGPWQSDSEGHWHECVNEDCTQTDTKANHSGTDNNDCTTRSICLYCAYTITAAETEHNYSTTWTTDDNQHWHVCQNTGCTQLDTKADHEYTENIATETYLKSAATCTAKAVYYKSCICGARGTETFENGEFASHTPAEAVKENEVAATCTQAGSYDEVVYCSVCGEKLSSTAKTIDKIAHTEEIIPAVSATCTTKGKTEGKKCSVCGEILVAQTETDKIAHTEEIIPAVSATCTAKGKTEGKKCSVCGEILIAQTETDKIAHTEEVIPAVAPTCTEAGKTAGKKCSVCNTVLQAQTTVAALRHNYGEWTVVKQATETEEGEERRVCANDNAHYESRTLPKITAPDNNGGEVVENKPQNGLSAGAIAGIVIGVIVFLLLAAYVACYFALYRRNLIEGKFFDVIYVPMNAIFGKKEQETE